MNANIIKTKTIQNMKFDLKEGHLFTFLFLCIFFNNFDKILDKFYHYKDVSYFGKKKIPYDKFCPCFLKAVHCINFRKNIA